MVGSMTIDGFLILIPKNTNEPPQAGGGLNSNPEWQAHKGLGPVVPTTEMANALEEPKVLLYFAHFSSILSDEPQTRSDP